MRAPLSCPGAALLAGLTLAWGGPALAQSAAGPSAPRPSIEAQAPAFTVGESWEFSFETALEPQKNEHYSQTVVAINDGRAAIAVNGGQSASLQLDASGNVVKTASGSFEPSDGKLQFPLSVGKRWSISYVYRTGTWASQVDRTANVVGVERIHTAAGDFDTFRIEQATSWSGSSGNGSHGGSRETDWYAPTTGRIVRMDYEDQSPRRPPTKTHAELTSFHSIPP